MARSDFHPGDIPAKPGVYVYRDRFGTVIYVGKASNLRRRMSHYFQPSQQLRADPKLRSLINSRTGIQSGHLGDFHRQERG